MTWGWPAAFERRVGLERGCVSELERGIRNLNLVALGHLAAALDVDPALLLEKSLADRQASIVQVTKSSAFSISALLSV